MKRSTLWVIGITTAIVTTISLHAISGSRYHNHQGFYSHHYCWNDKKDGENRTAPSSESKEDSTNRR